MTVALYILAPLAILLMLAIVFFRMPWSPLKSEFDHRVLQSINRNHIAKEVFTEADIATLPKPVQKHFRVCGYLDKPKMSQMVGVHRGVTFYSAPDKRLTIDYTQVNFAQYPDRYAFIDSAVAGAPFQGFDCYAQGRGSMRGVLGKVYTLFDEQGSDMDRASLVTVLSESLLIPSVALQDYIAWEAVDDTHARATIQNKAVKASGVFEFAETGEMLSFTTSDRVSTDMAGNRRKADWTAYCSNYQQNENGTRTPRSFKATWHYPEGDFTYFSSEDVRIAYQ